MVVRFDLEGDREAVTDRDDASVLARPLQHPRGFGGQRSQQRTRVLVRAVLAPERAHHAKLGERRLASQHRAQSLELLRRQSMLRDQRRRDPGIAGTGSYGHYGFWPKSDPT